MNRIQPLNIAVQLKGLPILTPCPGTMMGRVKDAIVNPIEGVMTGLLMATLSGDEQFLVAKDFHLFGQIGIVIVAEDALLDVFRIHAALRGGIRVRRDLIGAQVVTQSGKLLGRIADVYVMEEQLRIIYRVTSSRFQEVFGLGQYMLGDLSHRWSECGKRLIVAPHTAERDVFSSLKEAIRFAERRSAFAGVEE